MVFSVILWGPGKRGGGTVAQSQTVSIASDQAAIPVTSTPGVTGTGTVTAAGRVVLADNGGATTTARLVSSAASTNLTNVKATAGVLYGLKGYNASAAVVYLKLYNKATTPVIASDTALITHTIAIPPLAAFALDWPIGRYFDTGIGYSLIGAAGGADAGTTAVGAGDILGLNVEYR